MYVPLPLSVTEPIAPVPELRVIVTVAPPTVRLFPFASFACTVSTCVAVPFAVSVALVGVNVDCAASAAPATTVCTFPSSAEVVTSALPALSVMVAPALIRRMIVPAESAVTGTEKMPLEEVVSVGAPIVMEAVPAFSKSAALTVVESMSSLKVTV